MPTLSIIIIAKNEAHNIRRCLESVNWADEIIVLDSGSDDETVTISREYTDKVYVTDWPGFGPQKNRALEKATCSWVLSIDADEWVSRGLKEEIRHVVQKTIHVSGYFIPRYWIVCGKQIKYGDWGNDRVLRLFRRDRGRFTDVLVHEGLRVDGKIRSLTQPLYHQSITHIAQGIEKMNIYTSAFAYMKRQNGKKASLFTAVFHGVWMFVRSYFLRFGFLDGKIGFYVAFLNAEHSFYKYAKLWDPKS